MLTARSGCATKMPKLTIAIDGPAGSGKSSVARQRVAQILGYLYLDSGAMYRALALKAVRGEVALTDEDALEKLARGNAYRIEAADSRNKRPPALKNRVFLGWRGSNAGDSDVGRGAGGVASWRRSRVCGRVLVAEQQRAGAGGGVVMEGRDIGTVVFPHAELKIFLEASPEVRAERRWKEHQEKGEVMTLAQVLEEVRERDRRDRERKVSPLVRAADAVLVDNTAMDVEETARLIVMLAREREKELSKVAGREV